MPPSRHDRIETIRQFPAILEAAIAGLSEAQLTTHFLAEEWTVAQNVHHLLDSHMNSYIRLKLMLAEDNPTLRPYDQAEWAKMPDASTADLEASLLALQGLHARWASIFAGLSEEQWQRAGYHPEGGPLVVEDLLIDYSDHCEAHLEQISRTLAAQG